MYSSQNWWSSGAGGAPGPIAPIGNSLRFRPGGSTYLSNTNLVGYSLGSYTISVWVKKGFSVEDSSKFIITSGTSGTNASKIGFNNGGSEPCFEFNEQSVTTASSVTGLRHTDNHGWYHLVASNDNVNNEQRLWVNGQYAGAGNGTVTPTLFSESPVQIGLYADVSYTASMWDGYLSDFICVTEQVLPPTAFANYNEHGVWAPIETNFVRGVNSYSDYLTVENGTFVTSPKLAFNGDVDPTASGTGRCYTDPGGRIFWKPEPPVPFTSTLEIFNTNQPGQQEISLGTGATVSPTGGWVTVATGGGEVSASNPLNIIGLSGQRAELHAVRIDGQLVNDPFYWSSQLFTSPGYGNIDYNSTEKSFQSGSPIENAFDGQPTTFVQCGDGNSWFFKPQGLTATKIEIQLTNAYGDPTGGAFVFNDVEQTGFPGQSWYTVYEGEPITDWTIGGWYRPDGGNGFSMIRVNGVVLRDGVSPTYGAGGFHLDFSDPNDIGADRSGNGNHFVANNFDFSLFDSDQVSDSPTQNTATWSQLASVTESAANVNITDGALRIGTVSGQNWAPGYLTFGPFEVGKPGKYYFEMNDTNGTGNKAANFGVTNQYNMTWGGFWWDYGDTLSWYPENGTFYRNGTSTVVGSGNTGAGKAMAIDFENGTITAYDYSNAGVYDLTGLSSPLVEGEKYYIVCGTSNSGSTAMPFNFGQDTFIGSIPDGYAPLSTDNLPPVTIPNGRDHFQAITGPGQGSAGAGQRLVGNYTNPAGYLNNDPSYSPDKAFDGNLGNFYLAPNVDATFTEAIVFEQVQTGTAVRINASVAVGGGIYANGTFVSGSAGWIDVSAACAAEGGLKSIGCVSSTGTQDGFAAVEIDGEILIQSGILSAAQQTFPSGLWWVKGRNTTDENQLVNSDNDGIFLSPNGGYSTSYNPPTSDAVCWAWNYNSTTPSENGFEIIRYTGDDPTDSIIQEVPHRLGKAPEFFMCCKELPSNPIWVWHAGGGTSNGNLTLGNANQGYGIGTYWSEPTDTHLRMGPSGWLNANATDYLMYAWTSVPGYSDFGSYQGNSNVYGPFVYTGFKPAFLLTKRADSSGNWQIRDSSRNIHNPTESVLYADTTGIEYAGNSNIDFCANGFKVRTNDTNVNGGLMLYAAFAENPFASTEAPPTAR